MAWTIELERGARRSFDKLPDTIAIRIAATLKKIAEAGNPRARGIAMAGEWAGHWRYRIGDYRLIARIEEGLMVIVVVSVGHRREIYR